MQLEEILQEYKRQYHITEIPKDNLGVYRLLIDNKYFIMFEKTFDDKGFFLYSVIGTLHPTESNIAFEILSENLFNIFTKASIGFDKKTDSLVLWQHFDEESTTLETFQKAFDTWIPQLEYWTEKISL